ncbi:class A beta-lactamase-related serine hydrolase [Thalassotalea sp. HSM 43]|uniref:serine hydrolase domain-containing protein n=1 Tax=Thalassotalea sp. HSM 43 TaxID=2552945 RepID=UPI001080F8E3|nr:serine hydrolase domain-containing protein [Thalassotalea sp. HSM 43]QBY04379.1 class A beta-lactamase-related serine hydrolase [Thalassotalea sp. HSM 43]
MNKWVVTGLTIMWVNSAVALQQTEQPEPHPKTSKSPVKAGCELNSQALVGKHQLDNGLRSKVKFLAETESLRTIGDKMSEYKIPALSLALIKQGKIDWADTYQNSQFSTQQPLDCQSLFQAASLSKPVTVMAAVRMQAAGKINLDNNIQDYLTDFTLPSGAQSEDNPVTLRNIFAHTSGITPGGYMGYVQDLPLPSDSDILKGSPGVNSPAIAVVAAPNQTLAYSGGAYTLAELALQNVFDKPFADIMQRWILAPVAMQQSDFTQPLPAAKSSKVAKGYNQAGQVIDGGWHNYPEQAAAGLWSNSVDMAKFMIEIYQAYQGNSKLFAKSDIESLLNDERDGSVYGFIIDKTGGGLSITHYGGNAGYRTGMTLDLTSGNGLVYLINSDNGGQLGNELLLSAAAVYDWHSFAQIEVQRKAVNRDLLASLAGDYKWNKQIDVAIRFDQPSEQIALIFPNGDEYMLTPIAGEQLDFIHVNTGVTLSFLPADDYQSFQLYGQRAVKFTATAKGK